MFTTSSHELTYQHLGLPNNRVFLADYCSKWPDYYKDEKQRIENVLSPAVCRLEHIGSTAVPGLTSKPIIDIMLGITDKNDIPTVETLLQTIGYLAKGEMGIPNRLFFTWGNPCIFHLHQVEHGGQIWGGHVAFRNELLQNPMVAQEYLVVKKALAQKYPTDRESYTCGKATFIEQVLTAVKNRSAQPAMERNP